LLDEKLGKRLPERVCLRSGPDGIAESLKRARALASKRIQVGLGELPVEDLNVTTWRSSNPVLGLRLFD
jgi:hypothetical protein